MFAQAMIATFGNKSESARRAGYKSTKDRGYILSQTDVVQQRIKHLQQEYFSKVKMSAEEAIAALSEIARTDMKQIVKDVRIEKVTVKKGDVTEEKHEAVIEFHDWDDIPGHLVQEVGIKANGKPYVKVYDRMAALKIIKDHFSPDGAGGNEDKDYDRGKAAEETARARVYMQQVVQNQYVTVEKSGKDTTKKKTEQNTPDKKTRGMT